MTLELHAAVARALSAKPIVAVVRAHDYDTAWEQAQGFLEGGLDLIEVTFSVPDAPRLTRALLDQRAGAGPPFIGMGTVTTPERARLAVQAGTEFVVTPNVAPEVAEISRDQGLYLILGALTCSEIVEAHRLGADLVKVYPLPPVGGARYLETVRQPLSDLPMLAGGGFGIEEIPDYRRAGAIAFGIGPPLLGPDRSETRRRCRRAVELATRPRESAA